MRRSKELTRKTLNHKIRKLKKHINGYVGQVQVHLDHKGALESLARLEKN